MYSDLCLPVSKFLHCPFRIPIRTFDVIRILPSSIPGNRGLSPAPLKNLPHSIYRYHAEAGHRVGSLAECFHYGSKGFPPKENHVTLLFLDKHLRSSSRESSFAVPRWTVEDDVSL